MQSQAKPKLSFVLIMILFGTVGLLRRYIALSSVMLSFGRGLLGAGYLYALLRREGKGLFAHMNKKTIATLMLSGSIMSLAWILLFEAYRYTSIAVATLCFYMQPTIVLLASPLLFGEKLSPKKLLSGAIAILGMVFVSGVLESGELPPQNSLGVGLGLLAALCYAAVVLLNKKLSVAEANAQTAIQLLSASLFITPYMLFTEDFSQLAKLDPLSIVCFLVLGLLHTGFAYALYFKTIPQLKAQSLAILSYIDPLTAVLLSSLLFGEHLTAYGLLGAVCIIGAALLSELGKKTKNTRQ